MTPAANGRAPRLPVPDPYGVDSRHAWLRLIVALALMTVGSGGMYVISVGLPAVQADFGVDRSAASMPYTVMMIGFGVGGVLMGKLADRFGISVPVGLGALGLGLGFIASGLSPSIGWLTLAHALLIGMLGTACTFSPLVADTTLWFERHRGMAVAICASGNYLGGAIWPPVAQHFIDSVGWRQTYVGIGVFSMVTMFALSRLMRRRPPVQPGAQPSTVGTQPATDMRIAVKGRWAYRVDLNRPLGLSPDALLALLCIAGVACCVAMAMPQVHIVAYCTDLGFGAARGAQMLAIMLGAGIVSRLVSGYVSDRIGGLRTLLLGSVLQGVALLLFLPFDGLASLYVISALFGLFQGGIVPSYALIVREHFAPARLASRVALVVSSTLLGMALGGWMSGAIFDLTGSYRAAFINGIAWNLLNGGIAGFLLWRATRGRIQRPPQAASGAAPA